MRRKVFALTALLALVICSVAVAASSAGNKYTGSIKAGKKGVTSVTQSFKVFNKKSGKLAYPVVSINTTVGNIKVENTNRYPTCSATEINKVGGKSGKWNRVCKSGSLVAQGPVLAELYQNGAQTKFACHLEVNVYNDGKGKLTFFLTTHPGMCGPLNTGAASAWTATYKESGKTLDMHVPLPPDVSTKAGHLKGVWAAIKSETLNFKKISSHGPVIVSTGSRHAWSQSFTATTNGHNRVKATIRGK